MPTLQPHMNQSRAIINGVVVVLLFDFLPNHRSWAWLKLMQGTSALFKNIPGLLFAKVMGSGEGGGFTLRPSSTHQGLILIFDEMQSAINHLKSSHLQHYREKAREWWQGILAVNSCRGTWNQQGWQSLNLESAHALDQATAHEVSLTRGSIRAAKAAAFWKYAPQAQEDLKKAPGCELAVGLGEAPLLRQCTFSLWSDSQSLVSYAHQGAHQKAIAAAQKHGFFTESMFVRMRVLHMYGVWGGRAFDASSASLQQLGLSTSVS
jgi:spheroidene monooxygenase